MPWSILAQAENSEHISHWRAAAKMAGSGISPGTFGIPLEIFRVDWVEWNPLLLDRWGKDTKGCGPARDQHTFCMSLDVIGLGRSNSVGSLQNSWPRMALLIAFDCLLEYLMPWCLGSFYQSSLNELSRPFSSPMLLISSDVFWYVISV